MRHRTKFPGTQTIEQVEEGNDLAPKFDDRGLITVVTTDAESGELLMQGYMNAEALKLTIETGEAHYFSRSRQVLWHKGATSGFVQKASASCWSTTTRTASGCASTSRAARAVTSATAHASIRACRSVTNSTRLTVRRQDRSRLDGHGQGLRPDRRLRRRAEPDHLCKRTPGTADTVRPYLIGHVSFQWSDVACAGNRVKTGYSVPIRRLSRTAADRGGCLSIARAWNAYSIFFTSHSR